ncbi:putative Ig domain-containing protein [Bacteriovorax sp. DB6_IX]|uniref:putative Ig domain-containing protein n=1 Tax=Bacteriovorax sp. DB6_IX TaxID=1353530 RepID=UPI0009DC1A99|nr:putative Ig domain-containing protein [Bacteriovorax sp. DB6_IX]
MRTLKGISTFLVLVTLLQGCMPDSLTKFKEESTKKEEVVTETEETPTFKDANGDEITAADLLAPTSIIYDDQVITTNTTVEIVPSGALNDLEPAKDVTTGTYELAANMDENFSPVYSTTPTLPTGLSIDTKTGIITGVVTSPINITAYTVSLTFNDPSTGNSVTLNDALNITVQEEIPADFRITYDGSVVTKKLGIKLLSNSNFTSGVTNVATKTGATATVSLTDDNNFIYGDVTAGEILVGDLIDNNSTFIAPETSIESLTYYYEVNGTVNLVPASSSTTAIDSTVNSVTYEIAPDLPTGLTLDPSTGAITGAVASASESQSYTVTVSNTISTQTYTFSIAIIEAPANLAYTNMVVLPVDSTGAFRVGDKVSGNFSPPLTDGGKGEVVFIDSTNNNLVVKMTSGEFLKDQTIDQAETYVAEITTINTQPQPLTAILNVATPTNFNDYYDDTGSEVTSNPVVCQTTNAKATVTYKSGNLLFVAQTQSTTGNWNSNYVDNGSGLSTGAVFNESGVACDATFNTDNATDVPSTAPIAITTLWSPSMIVTLDAIGGFRTGHDVITASDATGYVASVSGTDLTISPSSTVYFDNGDNIGFTRPYSAAQTVTQTSTNMKFELAVSEATVIEPFLIAGQDIRYTIDKDLPKGLTLDNLTGVISGTPEETTDDTTFQITAKNVIGSEVIQINIEVNDYFEIVDTNDAPTAALHKLGQANNSARCRINKKDIKNFAASNDPLDLDTVDIDCLMDVGEKDIYNKGLKLTTNSGPAVCTFVDYKPFAYWQLPPKYTTNTIYSKVTNSCADWVVNDQVLYLGGSATTGDVAAAGFDGTVISSVSEAEICQGNYPDGNGGFVNCDEGYYILHSYEITEDTGGEGNGTCTVTYNVSTERVDCGGNAYSCLRGPVRDTGFNIDTTGYTSVTTFANNSLSKEFVVTAPIDTTFASRQNSTNKRIANFMTRNSCPDRTVNDTDYNSNGWRQKSDAFSGGSINSISEPFAALNPYYTFECLDGAEDTMARIRVMVRDWDRDFARDEVDKVLSSVMDDKTDNLFGTEFNERTDWDDSTIGYVGCDDSTAPTTISFQEHVEKVPGYVSGSGTTLTSNAGYDLTKVLSVADNIIVFDGTNTDSVAVGAISYNSGTKVTTITTGAMANTYTNAYIVKEHQAAGAITLTIAQGERIVTANSTASFTSTLSPGMRVVLTDNAFTTIQTVTVKTVLSDSQFEIVETITTSDATARMLHTTSTPFPMFNDI